MVVLGLGSNLGQREIHLKRAIRCLTRGGDAPLRDVALSRVYEASALVPEGAPRSWNLPYLNCAVRGHTHLDPPALLCAIKEAETSLGRTAGERWAPRSIDIDILWWPGQESATDSLAIPHPELGCRAFALKPLADLVPEDVLDGIRLRNHPLVASTEEPVDTVPAPESGLRVRFPALMGIVNVTPDSFSDDGRYALPEAALEHARRLVLDGATILDVGAESTRPGGDPVSTAEEWARLAPVLEGLRTLRAEHPFRVSLDTRNAATVVRALELGIDYINDVTGFSDPAMLEVAQSSRAELIFMHALSIPVKRREYLPDDRDVIGQLVEWAAERLEAYDTAGVPRHRLIFDPGIGFGKTPTQNSEILRRMDELHALGLPLMVGHSRKYFGDIASGTPWEDRDALAMTVSDGLVDDGVEILRLHEVANHDRRFRERFSAENAEYQEPGHGPDPSSGTGL